ncbi:Ubiquitin carboxyl-terminal hydrolase 32 [Lamellibrachia satsuma]|nr:Ubiquitin carboxyl-terminal hydrolase 32 [Lamellibrachia satsuma]
MLGKCFPTVSEAELKRLKDVFKRSSTLSGYMTQNVFIKEVLGDGVPQRLAERMFVTFGGSAKGISFKDLLCGLVMLTNYRRDEKIKFLFGLYANEHLCSIEKHEMDAFILATDGQVPQSLSELFRETDSVSFESFRSWIMTHPEATSVSKWLLVEKHNVSLSNDLETPTFHQTLAGVTHLEETDIMELEKRYWVLKAYSTSGRFDLDTFRPIVSPPIPETVCQGLFEAFDENCDNHIDFKEMACGISACCRGPQAERQKFCFKVFDMDHDGRLSQEELERMLEAMLLVRQENTPPHKLANMEHECATDLAKEILNSYDSDKDGFITQEEYLVWTVSRSLPEDFLHLLFQVSHVVLGLKPANKDHEAQVVCSWLDREERRGLRPGQVWYLVSMHWWNHWAEYVNYKLHQMFQQQQVEPGADKKPDCFPILSDPSSLCFVHHREASDSSVIGTSYTALPQQYDVLNKSPQSSPSKNAPHRGIKTGMLDVAHCGLRPAGSSASPAHSLQSTPSQSPRLNRKYNGFGIIQKPGAIDNTPLIVPVTSSKVQTLTNEGGRLKRDRMLARDRDFKLLPEPVWKALSAWYGSSLSLPRTVIVPRPGEPPELELYPISVRLLRHHLPPQPRPAQGTTTFTDVMGNIGGMMMREYLYFVCLVVSPVML